MIATRGYDDTNRPGFTLLHEGGWRLIVDVPTWLRREGRFDYDNIRIPNCRVHTWVLLEWSVLGFRFRRGTYAICPNRNLSENVR